MLIQGPATFGGNTRYVSIKLSVLLVLCVAYLPELVAAPSQSSSEQILTIGTPITGDLSANQTETYTLSTSSRQYVHISIEKGDLKLSVMLYDPKHHQLIEA